MSKNTPEEAQEFQLDLTHDKKEENTNGFGFGCDILQYSNDESLNEQYLKEIKEEEREQERKRQQAEKLRINLNNNPSQTNNEERKRERKAIFDKYRKREEVPVSNDNNIVVAFEEIFKRKSERHQEGSPFAPDHYQEHPFCPIARPEELTEHQKQRPASRIFGLKVNPPLEQCSFVVSDGNDMEHNNLVESVQTTVTNNGFAQTSLACSNVNANPYDSVMESLPDNNDELQQQASIHISGIRGPANNDALDASQEQSKEMMLEIENLLHQHIFEDVSQLESANRTSRSIDHGAEDQGNSPNNANNLLPVESTVKQTEIQAASSFLRTSSLPLDSRLDVEPHMKHAISNKLRATTVKKMQEVEQFLNDDTIHPPHVPEKDIDQFLKDSPVKKQELKLPFVQASQVFDYQPETNIMPVPPRVDRQGIADQDSDEQVNISTNTNPIQVPNQLTQTVASTNLPIQPASIETTNILANQPPSIAKINELLMQRVLQTLSKADQAINRLEPALPFSPMTTPIPVQPTASVELPAAQQQVSAPPIMSQRPSIPSSGILQQNYVAPNMVPLVQPVDQNNFPGPRLVPRHSTQPQRSEFSEIVNNLSSSDSIFLEPQANLMVCELMREAHRLNSFIFNLRGPNGHVLIPRCKDNLRRLIFELNMAGQTLWIFNEELHSREMEQTQLYTAFRPDVYMKGNWLKAPSRSLSVIKPGDLSQQQQRKLGDYSRARSCLINAAEVIKKLSDALEVFRIDPNSPDSIAQYSAVRKALDDITGNLVRISEDLYVKSSLKFLPEHFFSFYEYLSKNGAYPPFADLRTVIKQRQDMLTQLLYLRDELDPLCTSQLGTDLFNRLHMDIRKLKTDYFSMGRPMTPVI